MLIARIGDPAANPHACAATLDHIAEAALEHAGGRRDAESLASSVDYQLFSVFGFTGNSEDYGNPENSYLDRVIERRTGIPITLSLLYMEVAQRIGLQCEGVGYPGHFIVLCRGTEDGFYVDPFHQGARLDRMELLAGLRARAPGAPSPEMFLLPITRRQILQRMLNNLRMAYRNNSDDERWHLAVEFQLKIEPWNATLVGERGMLNYRLGSPHAALDDLQLYVNANESEAMHAGAVRLLEQLRTRLRTDEETS